MHERAAAAAHEYRYLRACDPVEVDVTLLSVADRLATRGRKADEAIAKHLELARELLGAGPRRRAERAARRSSAATSWPPRSGIAPGPRLGELLAELAEAPLRGRGGHPAEAIA